MNAKAVAEAMTTKLSAALNRGDGYCATIERDHFNNENYADVFIRYKTQQLRLSIRNNGERMSFHMSWMKTESNAELCDSESAATEWIAGTLLGNA
jgi:hypothetical protein